MTCFVYFIQGQDSGRIKIGRSVNPLARLASLQTSSPEQLALLGVVEGGAALERSLHQAHEQYHLHGEWFSPGIGLLADIRRRLGADRPTAQQEQSLRKAQAARGPSSSTTLAASIAAHQSWANTVDRAARTAPARRALDQKFLDQADGDPVRAEHLRKAHYQRLALKSAQARRRAKNGA